MSKPTSGVWSYRRATNTPVPVFHIFAKGKHGCIAQVQGDREGDARLFSASKELLEAARAARLALRSSAGPDEKMNAIRELDAAIAKAEGTGNG
jgi:hypothetical protein